ncbi:hypothetical protein HanIR_Chr13g0636501 [Helianthus annuus]|nr:hypothetical protein HanIR_Chr13g0636501 [Helianthus annuus]
MVWRLRIHTGWLCPAAAAAVVAVVVGGCGGCSAGPGGAAGRWNCCFQHYPFDQENLKKKIRPKWLNHNKIVKSSKL